METRTLGRRGPVVSALGLGCMGMSEFYGASDERECLATIDRAIECGINFLDTADMYGPFANEVLVGKATPAQVALAWVLAQGRDVVPIPRTKHVRYLEENLLSVEHALTSDDLARVDQAAPRGVTAGPRYPDMSTVNR